jgi:DNA-directed RNA polymerase specialized sigma24 family protein
MHMLVARLVRHARWLGASAELAEDLVQDALERHSRQPDWHDLARGDLETLLRVFVTSRVRDHRRRVQNRTRLHGHLEVFTTVREPDAGLLHDDASRARAALYGALDDELQRVFVAWVRQREGERRSVLAEELGLDLAQYEAVKKRLRRRCKTLLTELGLTVTDLKSPGGAR